MDKAEIHYLTCQSQNCERYACVARRDYEQKLLVTEADHMRLGVHALLLEVDAKEFVQAYEEQTEKLRMSPRATMLYIRLRKTVGLGKDPK